jgi:uncharacterized protein (DUF2062 family)
MRALLGQGVTPRRLAWSLALGAAIGIVPVLGLSTALCAAVALGFGLNMAALQLVNYLLTPVQLALIIPQLRLGEWLVGAPPFPVTLESGLALLTQGAIEAARVLAVAILHAALAWTVLAPVVALLLFVCLHGVLRRFIPSAPKVPR